MKEIVDYIKKNNNFIVTSHVSPDGDNIGSSIAMNRFLKLLGKNSFHVLDDDLPSNLSYITKRSKILSSEDFLKMSNLEENYTVIALDCGNYARLCIDSKILESSKIVNIDHHISNQKYGILNLIEPEKSSTCELVFNLLENFDSKYIDELIATSLYTGLSTDTGNFKFDNVSKDTFITAGKLLDLGAKKQDVVINIYQNNDMNYLKLKSDIILNNLEIFDNIAFISLEKKLLDKYSVDIKDTEDLVNLALNIKGIEVAILLKEKDDSIKASLRSKSKIDVNKIASSLGGGGHKRAAGFVLKLNIEDAKVLVINKVRDYIKNEWNN